MKPVSLKKREKKRREQSLLNWINDRGDKTEGKSYQGLNPLERDELVSDPSEDEPTR
jgi:hypothetical protein